MAEQPLTTESIEPLLISLRPWLSTPNVVGLTVGPKQAGGRETAPQAVVVHVVEKRPLDELTDADVRIPTEVELHLRRGDGSVDTVMVPTDVVAVGFHHPDVLNERKRPCPGAYQIKAKNINGTGTLGANIVWAGKYRLLTNNHVISQNGNIGADVYQPDDSGNNVIGKVNGYVPVVTYPSADQPNPAYNSQDIAYVDISTQVGDPKIHEIGVPKGVRAPVAGERIQLVGKQTGTLQKATIKSITLQNKLEWLPGKWAWFQQMIELDRVVTQCGDSGSAYVAESDDMVVGLHVGANNLYSWGCQLWPF